MNTQLSLLVLLLGATCALAHFKSGGNFCDDEKQRHDTCKPLVSPDCDTCSNSKDSSSSSHSKGGSSEGKSSEPPTSVEVSGSGSGSGNGSGCGWPEPGSGSGSGSGSFEVSGSGRGSGSGDSGEWEDGEYCFLLQVFLNYSIVLDVEIRQVFIQWINVTQLTIVSNTELTEYEILVQIYYSLQILFEQHVEIKVAIEFLYIGEWGYVCDLEGLALDIQTANVEVSIEQVIEIDVTTGTCPLIVALNECAENATSSEQAAIEVLIQKITVIIKGYYSFSETLVLIYKEFLAFFVQYPQLKVLIFSGRIEGFGVIQAYFDICTVYWRIEYFSVAVGGSASECELLQALIALYSNTSYSTVERSDFKQLEVKIQTYFESEISVQLRIQYFSEQLYQFFILKEWSLTALYSLEIKGYGNVYQLIYAYVYCINNGVGPGDFTVSTEPTTPTTTKLTTTPTTTKTTPTTTKMTPTTTKTTPTTTKPTTTTPKPNGNCGTVTSVNVVTGNMTKLLTSIDSDQNITGKWTTTEINTFLGYKKKIYNLSVNTTITASQKFTSIKQVLLSFAGSSTTVYQKVHAVFIVTWGTVSQYCGCSA